MWVVCTPAVKPKCADAVKKEIDDLVDDWSPEPLVSPESDFEQAVNEKMPVIAGLVSPLRVFYMNT